MKKYQLTTLLAFFFLSSFGVSDCAQEGPSSIKDADALFKAVYKFILSVEQIATEITEEECKIRKDDRLKPSGAFFAYRTKQGACYVSNCTPEELITPWGSFSLSMEKFIGKYPSLHKKICEHAKLNFILNFGEIKYNYHADKPQYYCRTPDSDDLDIEKDEANDYRGADDLIISSQSDNSFYGVTCFDNQNLPSIEPLGPTGYDFLGYHVSEEAKKAFTDDWNKRVEQYEARDTE